MKRLLMTLAALTAFPAHAQDIPAPLDLGPQEALTIVTQNGSHDFMVDIADETDEQIRGLMFRESMDKDKGMLFEFAEPKVSSIWMKNTAISLDILFVRSNGKILKIAHSAVPYSLRSASSEGIVGAVLEINGGLARELDIQAGDIIHHEFFGNAKPKIDE